jgi:dTDP-4-amino-4,6-dideoxygalactose transaminase
MECIDTLMRHRADLSNRYLELLAPIAEVKPQAVTARGVHSRQSFCTRVPNRGGVLSAMRDSGIEVQIGSYSLHQQRAFAAGEHCVHAGRMEGSRACSSEGLVLPLFDDLSEAEQQRVVTTLAYCLA